MPMQGGVGPWGATGGSRLYISPLWVSFSPIYPFQSRQKAKQTATTSNYHRQHKGTMEQCLVLAEDKKSVEPAI